jgi:hypothetical protein
MLPISLCRLLPIVCTAIVGSALAQAAPRPAPAADPLDPAASVPAQVYRSSLANDYRRLRVEPAVPWRDANETVGRIGGWRAYAREAAEPAAPEAAKPSAKGAETPHGHHKMH